jgi:hypothetical protein
MKAFSGGVDFQSTAENATAQGKRERVSAHGRANVNKARSPAGTCPCRCRPGTPKNKLWQRGTSRCGNEDASRRSSAGPAPSRSSRQDRRPGKTADATSAPGSGRMMYRATAIVYHLLRRSWAADAAMNATCTKMSNSYILMLSSRRLVRFPELGCAGGRERPSVSQCWDRSRVAAHSPIEVTSDAPARARSWKCWTLPSAVTGRAHSSLARSQAWTI